MKSLELKNLHVIVDNKEILKGISLKISQGEVVSFLGPNGHGKSTLIKAIMHHYSTEISKGKVLIDNKDTAELSTDEIARLGLYVSPQHSEEIQGVTMLDFLKAIVNARREEKIRIDEFFKLTQKNLKNLKIDQSFLNRFVNFGFSGGEKKKCEILQMNMLNPDFIMLDEIDSGLDVDSLKIVINEINALRKEKKTIIIVSHHEKLFKSIKPDKVYVIMNGTIAKEGGYELFEKIHNQGYEWINK